MVEIYLISTDRIDNTLRFEVYMFWESKDISATIISTIPIVKVEKKIDGTKQICEDIRPQDMFISFSEAAMCGSRIFNMVRTAFFQYHK